MPCSSCFLAGTAYLLERALAENSAAVMLLSALSLYLALLSHYSAILFAAAIGLYSLLRVIACRPSPPVCMAWVMGQAGAVGLIAALYVSHISKLKGNYAAGTINGWLGNSFYRPGHENPLLFVIARTGGVFQYVFGQLAIGDLAFVAFIAGVVLLWKENISPGEVKRLFPAISSSFRLALCNRRRSFDCQNLSIWRNASFCVPDHICGGRCQLSAGKVREATDRAWNHDYSSNRRGL